MTRRTKQNGSPTARTPQMFAVVAILMLVAAFAALGIIHAQTTSGLATSGPAAANTAPPLPPAKATFMARTSATARAGAGTPAPKLPYAPPAAQPTATLTAGIFQEHQGPFSNSDFSIDDEYQGPV